MKIRIKDLSALNADAFLMQTYVNIIALCDHSVTENGLTTIGVRVRHVGMVHGNERNNMGGIIWETNLTISATE